MPPQLLPKTLFGDDVAFMTASGPILRSTRGTDRLWQAMVSTGGNLVTASGRVGGTIRFARRAIRRTGRKTADEVAATRLNAAYHKQIASGDYVVVADAGAAPPPQFQPMLAATYNPKTSPPDVLFPGIAQPKADGVRCFAMVSPSDRTTTTLSSRRRIGFYNRFASLFHAAGLGCLSTALGGDVVIDCELVAVADDAATTAATQSFDFQKIASISRRVTSDVSDDELKSLRLLVFTYFDPSEPHLTHVERAKRLAAAFKRCKSSKVIIPVRGTTVKNPMEFEAALRGYLDAGYEGAMLYANGGVYEPGVRSRRLLKYKPIDTSEGVVRSVHGGEGRESASAIYTVEFNGKTFDMRPTGPLVERERDLADPSRVVGKTVTFEHQGFTDSGAPRFPRVIATRDYEG